MALTYRFVRANSLCKKELEVNELFFSEGGTSLVGLELRIHPEKVIESGNRSRTKCGSPFVHALISLNSVGQCQEYIRI